jgi:hypothetical protein
MPWELPSQPRPRTMSSSFQPSLFDKLRAGSAGLVHTPYSPRTSSWATFRRPFGTKFGKGWFSHAQLGATLFVGRLEFDDSLPLDTHWVSEGNW